jgi:hypothetical protein
MDVTWNCPQCRQELSADEGDAGQEIQCPTCGESQCIPQPKAEAIKLPVPSHVQSPSKPPSLSLNLPVPPAPTPPAPAPAEFPAEAAAAPAAEAAPAREPQPAPKHEHKSYSVPQHEGPAEKLVKKKAEAAPEGPKERRMRIRCIKRHMCEEVGHDKFEEVVTDFLKKVGEENIVSISPVSYGMVNTIGQTLNDYGVMIVYRG